MAIMDDSDLFRSNIARLRQAAGLTQNGLATAMREAGADHWRQTTVSRIESGQQSLTVGDLRQVAKVLGPGVYAGTEFEASSRRLGLAAADLYHRNRLRAADESLDQAERALGQANQALAATRRSIRESLALVDDDFYEQHRAMFDSDGNYRGED